MKKHRKAKLFLEELRSTPVVSAVCKQVAHGLHVLGAHGVRQATPEDGVVHPVLGQQQQDAVDECAIAIAGLHQPQLGAHLRHEGFWEDRFVGLQSLLGQILVADGGETIV